MGQGARVYRRANGTQGVVSLLFVAFSWLPLMLAALLTTEAFLTPYDLIADADRHLLEPWQRDLNDWFETGAGALLPWALAVVPHLVCVVWSIYRSRSAASAWRFGVLNCVFAVLLMAVYLIFFASRLRDPDSLDDLGYRALLPGIVAGTLVLVVFLFVQIGIVVRSAKS